MADRRLTSAQRRLICELGTDERAIFIMKHPRKWMEIRYAINSFPMRTLRGTVVATLAREGYLRLDKRGYYVLSTKGQLVASIEKERGR
jgi:hypothetical protein